jgi:hypothetical protein
VEVIAFVGVYFHFHSSLLRKFLLCKYLGIEAATGKPWLQSYQTVQVASSRDTAGAR